MRVFALTFLNGCLKGKSKTNLKLFGYVKTIQRVIEKQLINLETQITRSSLFMLNSIIANLTK